VTPRFGAAPGHPSLAVRRLTWDGCGPAGRAVHPHAVLVAVLEGSVRMWCGAEVTAGPGDLLLVPEGRPHHVLAAEGASGLGLSLCAGCVQGAGARELAAVFADEGPVVRTVPGGDRPALVAALEALAAELAAPRPWSALATDGLLAWLAATVRRASPTALPAAPAEGTLAARALAFVTAHATRGLSLADVARHVGRSPQHLAAVVKRETGQPVGAWITHARLAAARHLLRHTDDAVDAVGRRVGFASPSHFHRAFRRVHGTAPGAWRAAHRA
jgi:AraC-like DNA-binding protein